jgi:hypothetical protein
MNIDQPKGCPDPNIIRTFFWWYKNESKGRINERPSLSTVQFQLTRFANMYQRFYKTEIPQEIVNEIKEVSNVAVNSYLALTSTSLSMKN